MASIHPTEPESFSGAGHSYVTMTLENHATCQTTVLRAKDEHGHNTGAEEGFMVRIGEPWSRYPGEPNPDGEGYQDGTGHNLDCVTLLVRFDADGAPRVESLDVRAKHYRPDLAAGAADRREQQHSKAAERLRKLDRAATLRRQAVKIEREVDGA